MRSYLQEMVQVVVVEDLEILPIYRSIARCRLSWQSHFCCFFWSAGLKVEARHARSGLVGLGVRSLRCRGLPGQAGQGQVRSATGDSPLLGILPRKCGKVVGIGI